jgi:LemA protein
MQQKRISRYLIGGAILLILIIWVITSYNSLVKRQENVGLKWSEVQNTYQRRLSLVPNLVNIVKGEASFEKETLEKIAEARARAQMGLANNEVSGNNYENQRILQDSFAASANRMIILIEKYPNLKGTAAYAGLQTQLEGTERRIKVARNDFNAAVADYNRKVRNFPTNLVAGILGFKRKEGFQSETGSDKSIEIKF